MKPSEDIKPISYFKSHAAELCDTITQKRRTMIITQHGEAKIVVQDIRVYEELQDTLAMLKLLSQSSKSFREGRAKPFKDAFASVRERAKKKLINEKI